MRRFPTNGFRLRRRGIPLVLIAAALAAFMGWLFPGPPIEGRATVVDGDTLRIGSERIRLDGLDAVELAQTCTDGAGASWPCGREAKTFLVSLVAGQEVRCERKGRDRYRRVIARCTVEGHDLAEAVVRAGWAVTEYSYRAAQSAAEGGKIGIWQGTFVQPAEWRATRGEKPAGLWEAIRSWFR